MVKVSVIIPIYNVEFYLRDCMDSIVNQTLKDIEIICINDGSTDNSINILEEYAKNDERIIIISQENMGHAVATNRGIDLSSGKYLFFMDSDDILDLDALSKSYYVAEDKNVDFVIFKAINYDHSKNEYFESEFYSMNKLADNVGDNTFAFEDIGELSLNMAVTPWTKLYNKKFIDTLRIRFPEGLIFEDNIFYWESLISAKKIYFLKEFLYTRRIYDSSSTKIGDKRFIDSIIINSMIIDVFKQQKCLDNTFKRRLFNRKISLSIYRLKNIDDEYNDLYFEELQKNFVHWIHEENLYDYLMKVLEPKNKLFMNFVISSSSYDELKSNLLKYFEENRKGQLNNKIKHLQKEIKDNNDDIKNSFNKYKIYKNYLEQLNNRNNEIYYKNNKLIEDYNEEKELNFKITNSLFWKVTKPLRLLIDKYKLLK